MLRPHKRVLTHLFPQTRIRSVTGHHRRALIQGIQALLDRTHKGRLIPAPQIGTPHAAPKQGVAGDQQLGIGCQCSVSK